MTMAPARIFPPSLTMVSAQLRCKQTLLHCEARGGHNDMMLRRATAAIHQQKLRCRCKDAQLQARLNNSCIGSTHLHSFLQEGLPISATTI